MTYFEGFIVPVPEANKDAYQHHATTFAPLVQDLGVRRMVETWESNIEDGKVTDFRKAVAAKPDERIVFSWFEYPDRATRDATNEKMMADERMGAIDMPFDGKRMIMGGFEAIVDEGSGGGSYTDGFVVPVTKRDEYQQMAAKMAKVFQQHGATRVVEAYGDDVSHGEVTDFYRAVKAEDGEDIVFSFIEWPDKQARDDAWAKIMADESMKPEGEMPFNMQRMFWGGFDKILDTSSQQANQQAATPISA
jgi:uncharacterized protein YbaA (DUF1428 family)